MANLGKVVYLSEEQKNELFVNGTVTSNNRTITYSENDIYVTPDKSIDKIIFNNNIYTTNNGTVSLGTVLTSDDDYAINEMIAPVETSSTASQLYNVNDIFIYNKQLYKATSTIATSTSITPNNNCTAIPYLTNLILDQAAPILTGATSSVAGTAGLVPAPTTSDTNKFLRGDGTWADGGKPMVILSYGNSTWDDFINAYNNNVIVYCRASSNNDPSSGAQTRMAFMAYVNANPPTQVEFQYYRSVKDHSSTQMGDQVFIYTLKNNNSWSVTTREAGIKQIKAASGSHISVSYSSNVITLDDSLESKTAASNGTDVSLVTTGEKYIWNNKGSGTITGITMNGASKGTSGVVDLGTVLTAHQDISGKVSGPSSATDNAVAIFDGTSGKLIKNSGFTIGKSVPSDALFTDTTYSTVTQSVNGLMSASDKIKLDGIATGATANTGTITGITMNGVSQGTSGVVNLGTVLTAHQDISGKADKTDTVLTTILSRGRATDRIGPGSFAFGLIVDAIGAYSHAEGYDTIAQGDYSHAEGVGTYTMHRSTHAHGEWNSIDSSNALETERGTYVEIIGNGTADESRSNARALDWNGNEYLNGDLYVGCDADSTNGTKVLKATDTINAVTCEDEGYVLDARMGKYINDKVNNIGTIIDGTNNSNLTVESGAWVNGISSITLTAGHWIVIAHSRFSSSFTGDAAIALRSTSFIQQSIVRGTGTNGSGLCTVYIFSISSSNAPYSLGLSLYQNSGSDKTANYVSLRAIKISA